CFAPSRGSAVRSGVPRRLSRPVSSLTSRTAVSGRVSPGSSLRFGQDQSLYFGRWMRTTSRPLGPCLQHTAPAASTSAVTREDFCAEATEDGLTPHPRSVGAGDGGG